MNVKQLIKKAVEENDLPMVAELVQSLRFGPVRYTYQNTADLFKRAAGLELEDFEDLMQEIEARGV
jgi:hypothetical protein